MTVEMNKGAEVKKYNTYIHTHQANVKKAYEVIFKALNDTQSFLCKYLDGNLHILTKELVNVHDQSKFSEEEFEGYRQNFFPTSEETKNNELFQEAWTHHWQNNLHHWQAMKECDYQHPIIEAYTMEMICDWLAMAINFKEHHRSYYEKNKDKIDILEWQRDIVEEVYRCLDEVGYESKEDELWV